jgi:hypothetical protein
VSIVDWAFGGFRAHHCILRPRTHRFARRRGLPSPVSIFSACSALRALASQSPADPSTLPEPAYFNAAVLGQPVHWAGGQVNYYVDQGPLSKHGHERAGHGHGGRRCRLVERGSHGRRHAHRHGPAERGRERLQHSGELGLAPGRSPRPPTSHPRPPTIPSP